MNTHTTAVRELNLDEMRSVIAGLDSKALALRMVGIGSGTGADAAGHVFCQDGRCE